jgi:hypothetical protein
MKLSFYSYYFALSAGAAPEHMTRVVAVRDAGVSPA